MSTPGIRKLARGYAALAGTMDFVTGIALIALPSMTLGLMGVQPPDGEAIGFVRFVGVFVGAVGATYLAALSRRDDAALHSVFEWTLLVRVSVGVFVGVSVTCGMLDRGWLTVSVTDLGCAAIQAWFLWKGLDGDA